MLGRFLRPARAIGKGFTPLGVIQGWSAESMAKAALKLVAMGYDYLAIGGTVPLKIEQIRRVLSEFGPRCPPRSGCIFLALAKSRNCPRSREHRVTSFDTTSPLLRAFKDARKNYWVRTAAGRSVLLHRDPHSSGY